jgi:hypothetical protein
MRVLHRMITDLATLDAEDDARDARLAAPAALLAAALWYAKQGIAVFPLRPGGKTPDIRRAHPDDDELQASCKRACGRDGHGLYDATTDADRISAWWAAVPARNIATPTGIHFDAIDLDGPIRGQDGYLSLLDHWTGDIAARNEIDGRPLIGKAKTASGGRHLLIAPTGDGNSTHELPGVDYRGIGGYIALPPSRSTEYNGAYAWITPLVLS